jgi:7-keto-8-aminopelargonate synthetase-like enzyme
LASAALQSVKILKADKLLRRRLHQNSNYMKIALRNAGLYVPDAPGPILRLTHQSKAEIAGMTRRLLAAGIFPPLLKYPGGPVNGYLRFVISSEHSRKQLDNLIGALVSS